MGAVTDQDIMEMWWACDYMTTADLEAFWDLCSEFDIDLDIPF